MGQHHSEHDRRQAGEEQAAFPRACRTDCTAALICAEFGPGDQHADRARNRERLQAVPEPTQPRLAVRGIAGCDLVQREPSQAQDGAGYQAQPEPRLVRSTGGAAAAEGVQHALASLVLAMRESTASCRPRPPAPARGVVVWGPTVSAAVV